jgi:peptidoglycan/xylan/chitin deacetylase (PgdA/CDA1 family)
LSGIGKFKGAIASAVELADSIAARVSLATVGDNSSLIVPFFHGIFPDEQSTRSKRYYAQQGVTLEQFRILLRALSEAGFQFIRPEDLHSDLREGRYALLTFDDGYANNLAVLPTLHEFKAPAVFFISAKHVETGKAFWWDVLYRETMGVENSPVRFATASAKCKTMRNCEIEEWLKAEFKLQALSPTSDVDRPMTPEELRRLSTNRFAVIGNHTLDHAILTNYSSPEVRVQIGECQEELRRMTGLVPSCIAYPNGNWSPAIVEIAQALGLDTGVCTLPGRNPLPLEKSGKRKMALRRALLWGDRNVNAQIRYFRSAFSIRNLIAELRSGI